MFLSGFLLIKKDLMLKCLNKVICFVKNLLLAVTVHRVVYSALVMSNWGYGSRIYKSI